MRRFARAAILTDGTRTIPRDSDNKLLESLLSNMPKMILLESRVVGAKHLHVSFGELVVLGLDVGDCQLVSVLPISWFRTISRQPRYPSSGPPLFKLDIAGYPSSCHAGNTRKARYGEKNQGEADSAASRRRLLIVNIAPAHSA